MAEVTIYHNPRCSKSRQTLTLLQEAGVHLNIIEYLKHPPSKAELHNIITMLNCQPRDIMRRNEDEYRQLGLQDETLDHEQLLGAIAEYPKLMQRPIVIHGKRAAIGRPPEAVLEILS